MTSPIETNNVVERLCELHKKMLLAVERDRPYSPSMACGKSDLDTVLDAAVTLERAKADRQSLSDRIDRLEAQLKLLAGIEDAPPPPRTGPVEYGDDRLPKKIWDKIEVCEDGCWLWHGRMGTHGYGQISGSYQSHNAHRYIYAALIDKVPDGMVCDHLCRVRQCVNPAHIEVVTNGENVRRGNVLRTGNKSASRKLSEDEVKIIYSYKGQHGMGTKLARRFQINQGNIYKIWSGEYWSSVTGAQRSDREPTNG